MDDEAIWIRRLNEPGEGPALAIKDCIDVAGLPTTVGSQAIAEQARPAAADAAVVAAARRAGARIVGKTNLTELCWSANGVNSWSGTPANPLDPERLPGGSSSGSAVAVALGQADVALGTDTAGSIRIPAACCGVVGLKPTWGRVPAAGVYPLARSMDAAGPLGPDVAAVEFGMRLLEPGFAAVPGDAAVPASVPVGRLRPGPQAGVDPLTDQAVDVALAAAGLAIADVPSLDLAAVSEAGNILIDVEAYQVNKYLAERAGQLSPHIVRNLAEAAEVTGADEAQANRMRQEVRDWLAARLARHPVLALPTLMGPPPRVGERGMSWTRLTIPANLAGLPALAMPVPGGPAGLPASLQLIGRPGAEEQLIGLARVIESALR